RFLPSTRLRDMDGVTQVLRPQNDLHEVTAFIKRMKKLDWARGRILKRSWAFFQHYRRHLNAKQMGILLGNGARLISPSMNVNNMAWLPGAREQEERTYVTTTQPLSRLYTPNVPMPAHLEGHFAPTMITDAQGALHPMIAGDVLRTERQNASAKALRAALVPAQ
ncbi:MAG: hypothetical protein AAGA78_19175, partial [Pseudomonadota bacterium]